MDGVIREQIVLTELEARTRIEDITDKPLVDALIHNAGIPREQIVLAYRGEVVPEEAG